MNFSAPFIKRPVMTTMILTAILLFGLFCFRKIPVSDLPDVEYPTIVVNASMPGGNPQYMANSIATPLEQAFSSISGIQAMTSTSTSGSTEIVLNFELGRNLDGAEVEVQGAISKTLPLLPPMPSNPTFERSSPSRSPILYLTLSSDSQSLAKMYEYAKNLLAEPLSMISGVSEVNIFGHPYAVRIQTDPDMLHSHGLDFESLTNLIVKSNPNLPGGNLIGPDREIVIEPFGMLTEGEEYNEIVLKQENGALLKLKEIGQAVSALRGRDPFFHLVDKDATKNTVVLAIKRQSDANTIAVTHKVREKLPILQKSLPGSVQLSTFFDSAKAVVESVHDVEFTLVIAFVLVVLVIFIYLGTIKETVIPSLVLPFSIVAAFIVIYVAGFSIDTLSLLALTLAIGFIIDDAIVVMENIVRHLEMGKKPFQAALDGSKEISTTVLTMTIALSAVFIPMLAMPGMLGRIFREFSVTIIVTILSSGFISLTLNPMLCNLLLKEKKKERKRGISEKIQALFASTYISLLKKVVRYKKSTLTVGFGCLVSSFIIFAFLPMDFFPGTGAGLIVGITQCEQGSSIIHTNKHQECVEKTIQKNPYQESFLSLTGVPAGDQGLLFIRLIDESKRPSVKMTAIQMMESLRKIPGINTYLMPYPLINLQVGNSSSLGEYQFALSSLFPEELYKAAPQFVQKLKELPEVTGINTDMKIATPQLNLHIDRDLAGMFGVSAQDIENTLQLAFSGGRISTFTLNRNLYELVLETNHPFQYNTNNLDYIHVKSDANALVPLSSVARWEETLAPSAINHLNQFPSVTVSFNLASNASLGTVIEKIGNIAKITLPGHVSGTFIGEAEVFNTTFQAMKWLIPIAIIVIYLILGILYESFLHPLTVLSALPVAGLGALLTLLIFGESLSLYGILGIIVLIGLVQKNGIMMIDYALEKLKNPDVSAEAAILEACKVRFRPIMMTTLAAMVGVLPIALGFGEGGDAKRTLGLAIVGGLIFSQALTLFITPVVFLCLENKRLKKVDT